MTMIDEGRKPEGAPERSPKAGEGALATQNGPTTSVFAGACVIHFSANRVKARCTSTMASVSRSQ